MHFEPIAIVGQACVLPGALNPSALWENVQAGRDLTSRTPAGRWGLSPSRLLRDAKDPQGSKDAAWTDRGGYVDGFESVFNPSGFHVDASLIQSLDPLFQWVLHTGREALHDAGVRDTTRTGAIFGNLSFPSSGMAQFAERTWLGEERAALAAIPQSPAQNRFMSGLPAHFMAKALGLGGAAYCLDAACASSLYAIKLACDQLQDRKADVMLAGAVNRADDLFIHVGFTALKALSPSGQSRPFHPEADGLVPAEGAGFVVLKRLVDAERNGDTIAGVIRGVGLSNDGRGSGFLAPSSEGQVRAMKAAYAMSGLTPHDISLVECHATGTTVGDATELKSMQAVYADHPGLPIGSIKANLGHPITAAGVAGLIKVLGAMKAKVLPPNPHATEGKQTLAGTPFTLNHQSEAWNSAGPRRAALSAFGFGGNNAHLIVEEYAPGHAPAAQLSRPKRGPIAIVGMGAQVGNGKGLQDLEAALFTSSGLGSTRAESIELGVKGLKFPPRDLEQALGQQLTMLATAREALERTGEVNAQRTGVFVGMGTDPEVARYGVRWRIRDWAKHWGQHSSEQLSELEDHAVATLESPGVLGTMPNVVANRLSSQFNFTGQGFTISSEELSGVRALEVAMRALQSDELETALVGAVDMSAERVHQEALAQLGLPAQGGDGAISLVLERLEDAQAKGRTIYAILDEDAQAPRWLGGDETLKRLGKPHAATGLLQVATLALSLGQRRALGGSPQTDVESAQIALSGLEDQTSTLTLKAGPTALHAAQALQVDGPTLSFSAHAPDLTFDSLSEGATMTRPTDYPEALLPLQPQGSAPQVMAPAPALAPMTAAGPGTGISEVQQQVQPAAPVVNPAASELTQAPAMGGLVGALLNYRQHLSQAHIAFATEQARAQAKMMALQTNAQARLLGLYPRNLGTASTVTAPHQTTTASVQAPATQPAPATLPATVATKVQAPAAPISTPPPAAKPILKAQQNEEVRPVAAKAPVARKTDTEKPGLKLNREQLKIHASGKISEIYGPLFQKQDGYARQVRMPEPPLLLADRVTGLDAEPGSMGKGTIWTETDVTHDAWYMHDGRMPAGIMIESGQADLMLISYLGVDFLNQGERVYRLLGCDLTYHKSLPKPGETLAYDIHVDGHATQGDIRLFFFHYDCCVEGEPRLTVRNGQAGFFTDEELADSKGILWEPETGERSENPRLDPPKAATIKTSLSRQELEAFADGSLYGCFGKGFEFGQTHTSTARIAGGKMLFMDEVTHLEHQGGPWGRGYLRATQTIRPDDWFFDGHFKNDSCMPGTLMFEGCLQTMALYLASLGYSIDRDGWRFEPIPEETYALRCRGQVLPSSRELVYEVFVDEVMDGDTPKLYADILCTIDGLKAFHCRRMGLQLTPDWPLEKHRALNPEVVDQTNCASIDGFTFDYASLLACAWGKPSAAFGPMYERFDSPTRVARLPGPPYHFMSRVPSIDGEIGALKTGQVVDVEYDIPESVWYFDENGQKTMPFCVLLEAALQPCGWLASYVGSALTTDQELFFRNLDGTGTLKAELTPGCGTLRTRTKITNISQSAGMIIESFDVECYLGDTLVYDLKTVFGFFPNKALQNQKGLDTTDAQRALLTETCDQSVDLTLRPERYSSGSCKLARDGLLMIDRVTGIWPEGGEKELGRYRSEKDIDPDAWFFKAHFFQDPVQPGSLGIEAMIQLLQFAMLEQDMDEGFARPQFESLALEHAMTWKYRGQVKPHNNMMQATLDITETGHDARGVYALAKASLWVDGKRIYEASNIGMRIIEAPEGNLESVDDEVLDPSKDTWLNDHCPTWTTPVLPMMSVVDRLAGAAATQTGELALSLHDVELKGWITVAEPTTLTVDTEETPAGIKASLKVNDKVKATSRVVTAPTFQKGPAALEPLKADATPCPYQSGALFHGPSFQLLESWVLGKDGASGILNLERCSVPCGHTHQALLDAVTHIIPHDDLHQWSADISGDRVAYPARITELSFHSPAPRTGKVRAEVRFAGFYGTKDFPKFQIQLLVDDEVWMNGTLVEALFPKGPIGRADRADRLRFLRDKVFVPGLSLSQTEGNVTILEQTSIDQSNWLAGTVESIYGSATLKDVATREHIARQTGIHPSVVKDGLPLSNFSLGSEESLGSIRIWDKNPETLNLAPVKNFWSNWFKMGRWPVEDLYYGLAERFVERLVFIDPKGLNALKGQSVLYLANHQVGIESLLFSILTSGLLEVPTVTLAKAEHRESWLGKLIAHSFNYPDVADPKVIAFFDREDRESLPRIIGELGAEMKSGARSVMVHVEGTRALSCREPVQKMTGAFIDMAIGLGIPIVPVRFTGGLPTEPLDERIEFPLGLGKQTYWLGSPLLPEDLAALTYGDRKKRVINAINGLGPSNAIEEPSTPAPEAEARVRAWGDQTNGDLRDGVLLDVLKHFEEPCEESRLLLETQDIASLPSDAKGQWLATLARQVYGDLLKD